MELRPYQKKIANWLCDHPHACLSVGMGLGKTAAVLHFIDYSLQLYPWATFLIVAPKRVAETVWRQEAEKWGLERVARNMVLVGGTAARKKAAAEGAASIKIVSRDNLKYFENAEVDVLVIDELTSFKNMASERTRLVLSINAQRKIGMTGTFAPNGLLDIYAQLAAVGIASPELPDYYAWRGRWFVDIMKGAKVSFSKWALRGGVSEADVLKPWIDDILTLTADDYLALPRMMFDVEVVGLSAQERKAYDELAATLHFELPGTLDFTVDEMARFAKLQTLCSGFVYDNGNGDRPLRIVEVGAKVEAAVEFCRRAAAEGESVLLFYQYRETAVWFGEQAIKEGLRIASVKGGDYGWLERWNAGELDVLVANPASAGHGLNLQHGGHVVLWLELTYNYEYYAQANARLHRTGQVKPVQVAALVAEDTVDGAVWGALQKKSQTNRRVEAATR